MKRIPRRQRRLMIIAFLLSATTQMAITIAPRSLYARIAGRSPQLWTTQSVLTPDDRVWLVDLFDSGPFGEVLYAQTIKGRMSPDSLRYRNSLPIEESVVPGWARFQSDYQAHGQHIDLHWAGCFVEERAEGWPWRCVRGERHTLWTDPSENGGRWQSQVARSGYVGLAPDVWMPVWPIWSGLVLDLTVFALPCYLLLWAGGTLRRRRRAMRGRCVKCNYDLVGLGAGAVCPECGTNEQTPN